MSGAIHLLPQYAFVAWCSVKKSTGTILPSLYPSTTLTLKMAAVYFVETLEYIQQTTPLKPKILRKRKDYEYQ
jgi:hypothetical protein